MLHAGQDAIVRTFTVELSSEETTERIESAVSFIGSDKTGSFGILGGHEPFVTILSWGLCSLRTVESTTRQYLAVPGGVLYFADGVLHVCARRFVRDDDPVRIVNRLTQEMHMEEEASRDLHALLRNLDRELLRRLVA
jgi:F-type H+-transporting ATPase subunit epsilon